ncbi:MAG: bifunctional phosphoribosylaminoimidazolecarboxamide formyltransferase/IMP cyclohydrolase [Gaiellaceae bacterium]
MIKRALISVYDTTGLDDLARGLADAGCELLASGGSAAHLRTLGLAVTEIDHVTKAPDLLGGRVKTLHPAIHAAILARRDNEEDLASLHEREIEPIDLVCVNFFPFAKVIARYGVREEDAVEMIDVAGPAIVRGAAKNFRDVAVLSRPDQYGFVLDEIRQTNDLSADTRRQLAAEAFATSAAYESSIAAWFADREPFPDTLTTSFIKVLDLPHGENPHQRAALYAEANSRRHLLSRVEQLHGRELGFNNLHDLSVARLIIDEFTLPACVIVKHGGPCGVAVGASPEEAFIRALAADPTSAEGGVVILNRPVSAELGQQLADQLIEVLFAPAYAQKAIDALRAKNTRVLTHYERRRGDPSEKDYKRVLGGLLAQDRDWGIEDRSGMEVVCGEVDEEAWGDLLFAWKVGKHVKSNAIVVARGLQTIGIGAGQPGRMEACRLAVEQAKKYGHTLTGASLASDAFLSSSDAVAIALEAGITSIIQPGGSRSDRDVIESVRKAGAAMVFTHRRHFAH